MELIPNYWNYMARTWNGAFLFHPGHAANFRSAAQTGQRPKGPCGRPPRPERGCVPRRGISRSTANRRKWRITGKATLLRLVCDTAALLKIKLPFAARLVGRVSPRRAVVVNPNAFVPANGSRGIRSRRWNNRRGVGDFNHGWTRINTDGKRFDANSAN